MKSILTAAVAGLAAACSSGPEIRADVDPTVDLQSYKTFGFFDKPATDSSAYGTLLTTRLKAATGKELERRGYTYATDNPQLLVNFNVNVMDKTKVESTPSMGYYGYRTGMYGMWAGYPQDVYTVNYKDGTLAIDIVDAQKRQLVWQGVAQGRISESAMKDPGPAIARVVAEIFEKYPTAPGAVPQATNSP